MRLAIINLTAGGLSGGYKKYLANMLPRMATHKDIDSLLCVYPDGGGITPCVYESPKIEYGECSALSLRHLAHIPDRKMMACVKKFSPDIVFFPVDRYINFHGIPVVNMVRNMEPFVPNMRGDSMKEKIKKLVQRKFTTRSVRRADHTIAVSIYVKDYLMNPLGVDEGKISMVHHGLSSSSEGNISRPASIPTDWDRDFLFTCGSVRPARGLEDILQALVLLKQQSLDIRLVIAGETSPGMRKYRHGLEGMLTSRGLGDSVCWTGCLNDEEMRWCYKKCRLFVMTSRIEACPNIAIEAMSNGCISIATDNPPMPEFFLDLAAYYEPGNAQALATIILSRLSLDDSQRSLLAERSRIRSKQFSWDRTAEMTLSVLTQVLNQSRGIESRTP
jgi:glycosyltransferase involved in cell wall biosynthesis